MEISPQQRLQIWKKCRTSELYNEAEVRLDACGAWIVFTDYNNPESPFGWEVDHIYPKAKLAELGIAEEKINDIINLRALNIRNNRSKGVSYPVYTSKIAALNDKQNHEVEKTLVVNQEKQIELSNFYGLDND